jgi:hypothetical protein
MNDVADRPPLFWARVAGLAYIVVIVLGIFSVSYIDTGIVVQGNDAETVDNLVANEWRYRVSVAGEVLMYALVIILAAALYIVLRAVNSELALLALLFRLGEAIIGGGATLLGGLMPLLLIRQATAYEAEQLQALVGLFLEVRNAGLDIVLVFVGVGGTLFCYLFYRSNYVPRILAAWGMFTYLSMLLLAFAGMLVPDIPESIKMTLYAPGGLFELILGFWLMVKGVNNNNSDRSRLP